MKPDAQQPDQQTWYRPFPLKQPLVHLTGQRDTLFASTPYPKAFEFNQDVVDVFDDMVSRSVPLYREVNQSIAEWTLLNHIPDTAIYDIGCSTGTTMELIGRLLPSRTKLVGIDQSAPMIDRAEEKLAAIASDHEVELVHSQIDDARISNASMVIMAYTLQFVPVAKRPGVLKKIFEGLVPGGILYLCEKTRGENPRFAECQTRIYEEFKVRSGYSRDEISRKKEALDNVLVPLSLSELTEQVLDAGFTSCEPMIKWNNFASLVALKT